MCGLRQIEATPSPKGLQDTNGKSSTLTRIAHKETNQKYEASLLNENAS